MSSGKQESKQHYSEQLSDFESQLRHTLDDESLQQDVLRAIRELLTESRDSEDDIRRILRNRSEAGEIRDKTRRVVERMLDRVVSEHEDTMPDEDDSADFGSTDVIPRSSVREDDIQDQLQPGSVLRDRFLLQQRISGGSMGVVYKALDRRMAEIDGVEPWVAIKVLTPKLSRNAYALRAIQQEAAKGRCLSHPNIVRFIDLDREEDVYFLVMEWIEGRSLASILDSPGTEELTRARMFGIIREIGSALEYAHRCGVVHADVKPGNVMIAPNGEAKLIDFGVARIRQSQQVRGPEFDPRVLGAATPAYSSMQVLTGEEPVPADDVFSLACLTYRLVAGYRVFGPRNAAEAAEEGMTPQRPQGLSDHQWRVLKKALSFSRVTRYVSPRDFVDEFLADAVGSMDIVPGPVRDGDAPVQKESASRWPWIAVLTAVIAVAGAVAYQNGVLEEYLDAERLPAALRAPAPRPGPASGAAPADSASAGEALAPAQPTETPEDQESGPTQPAGQVGGEPEAVEVAPDADETTFADADGNAGAEADTNPDPGDALASPERVDAHAIGQPAVDADVMTDPDRPPATHTLALGSIDSTGLQALRVSLREDDGSAEIDLVRSGSTESGLQLVVEEVSFSGNRSPWESGQYSVADDGSVRFAPGQSAARLSISMTADPVREPDLRAELVLRDVATGYDLGIIDLSLLDDDQRRFEAGLPPNSVGFASGQVAASESVAAVQIDLVRYRPDDTVLSVRYRVQDVTATRDEDYFAPAGGSITFEAGQRAARLIVPLVQDADVEADEAFFIELVEPAGSPDIDIFRRIAVMIRDDDS